MAFFEPRDCFFNIIRDIALSRIIVDCGCGDGELVDKLNDNQMRAIGIDLYADGGNSKILPMDAAKFPFKSYHLPLIARPCRGPWIHDTINAAFDQGVDGVVYIGLDKHTDDDLVPLVNKYDMYSYWSQIVGNEQESITLLTPKGAGETLPNPDIKFCLLRAKCWGDKPYWMEDGGDRWINMSGGWMDKRPDDEVLETAVAKCHTKLDWKKTGYYDPDFKESGWLGPKGEWYGCGYMQHDTVVQLVIRKTVTQLEQEGWLRVHSTDRFDIHKELTQPQIDWLFDNGHDITKLD